jgi:cysteinyl-tRNA synthetase
VWKLDDPAALAAERQERLAAAAAAARTKLANLLDKKEKELDKWSKLAALPSISEALADKYSRWDEAGEAPTHDKEGAELDGKAKDKAKKEADKARKVREPLAKRLAEDPGFLGVLGEEVEALRRQLAALDTA